MGNHEVLASNIETLKAQNWVEAGQDQENAIFSNVNPFRRRLLANIITHDLIQEYELNFITEQDYNSYVAQLSYRQMKSPSQSSNMTNFIYPIRYFDNKSKHQMCTTIHTGYLYADKVELRLKEINDIPFQDLLYMYKSTLSGFKMLYEKVGYFDIIEEMIFITKRGEVKVWMNANLAKNYPNYQKTSYNSTPLQPVFSQRQSEHIYGSQADMIRQLILMIEKNSDECVKPNNVLMQQNELFSQFLQQKNLLDKLSFQHSLDEFQKYLRQNNLHCPDYMRSIPELFAPEQLPHNGLANYEQSHVNQITSQHLTQMKRKFEPMETIIEDERINTKTTSKTINFQQGNSFKESHVSAYSPTAFSIPHQNNVNQIQHKKFVRPLNRPVVNLNQSRYSQQSNKIKTNEYAHLQKSSHSSKNVNPYLNQKLNSVSSHKEIFQRNIFIGQPIPSIQNQSMIPRQQNLMTGDFREIPKFDSHLHQVSHRITMISPPPSFRVISGSSQIHYQQTLRQPYPSGLPSSSFESFQKPPDSNFNQGIPQFTDANYRKSMDLQKNMAQTVTNVSLSDNKSNKIQQIVENLRRQSLNEKEGVQQIGMPLKSVSIKNQSSFKEKEKEEHKSEQKSRIKYFTKSDSYQLDEEIAHDLERFLGLKVN